MDHSDSETETEPSHEGIEMGDNGIKMIYSMQFSSDEESMILSQIESEEMTISLSKRKICLLKKKLNIVKHSKLIIEKVCNIDESLEKLDNSTNGGSLDPVINHLDKKRKLGSNATIIPKNVDESWYFNH